VLVFHAFIFTGAYGAGDISADYVRVGRAGVDIFFVISGFILTLVTQKSRDPGEFVLGRLARVGVPYWVVVLGLAAMTLTAPGAFRNFTWQPQDLALSLAFIPSILRDDSIFPLLEPGWTLSLEMLFYLLLAATLGVPQRYRSPLICLALVGLAAAGFAMNLPQGQSIAWFFTQAVLIEFCFGIILAQIYLSGWRSGAGGAGLLLILGGLGLVLAAFYPPDAFGRARFIVYGLPAALIVSGALLLEATESWRRSPIMAWLGDISYSLYLVHLPMVAGVAKVLGSRIGGQGEDVVMLVAAMAAALLAATMFHHLIERSALHLAAVLQARRRLRVAQAT
jgi:exopolysaccharide production protein ExoZ